MELKIITLYLVICLRLFCGDCRKTLKYNLTIKEQVSIIDSPYLILVTSKGGNLWCTGALISTHYVITSAHCVQSTVGYLKLPISSEPEYYQEIECIFKLHTWYSSQRDYSVPVLYDIALAEVNEPIEFTKYVQPISLKFPPWPTNKITNSTCIIVGFRNIHNKYFTVKNVYTRFRSEPCIVQYGPETCHCIPSIHTICLKSGPEFCIDDYGSLLICDNKLIGIHSKKLPTDICSMYLPKVNTNILEFHTPKCYVDEAFNVFTYLPSHNVFFKHFTLNNTNFTNHLIPVAEEVPYLVLVTSEGTQWCTGALISEYYVITSAHCVRSVYGYIRIPTSNNLEDTVVSCIFQMHTWYTSQRDFKVPVLYDIALAEVNEPIEFTKYVQPISIKFPPWPTDKITNSSCIIVGFRKVYNRYFAVTNMYNRYKTNEILVQYGPRICDCIPFKHAICLNIGPELCIDDYGSLLVCNHKLIGIHSKKLPTNICGIYNNPNALKLSTPICYSVESLSVFTYIPSHIEFIKQFQATLIRKYRSAAIHCKQHYRILLLPAITFMSIFNKI
ncbi:hypothetical protein O3M35_003401 [Rhynocoris fuscipes]|uniref:Peptidase S1 domain-containing protein n=1 Tax=Rhynocoris fuscipes TaxID=488301 RepID=A0AAW1CL89_9HEMI